MFVFVFDLSLVNVETISLSCIVFVLVSVFSRNTRESRKNSNVMMITPSLGSSFRLVSRLM
jgi:hypothetical protein